MWWGMFGITILAILAIEKITAERNGYVNELSYVSPDCAAAHLISLLPNELSYVSPDSADSAVP